MFIAVLGTSTNVLGLYLNYKYVFIKCIYQNYSRDKKSFLRFFY